jgi:hypothetical protein
MPSLQISTCLENRFAILSFKYIVNTFALTVTVVASVASIEDESDFEPYSALPPIIYYYYKLMLI